MVTGWEHFDWHTRGWFHAVLRFLVAFSVLLISRTLEVSFQSSFIEKEARVTSGVLYFSGFLLFVVRLLGTLGRRWQLAPAFRLVDQSVFVSTALSALQRDGTLHPWRRRHLFHVPADLRIPRFSGRVSSRYASVSHQLGFQSFFHSRTILQQAGLLPELCCILPGFLLFAICD